MTPKPKCPDCRVAMEEGFVPDFVRNGILQSAWRRGPVEKFTFFGIDAGVRAPRKDLLPILTFRCPKCGLLAAYAHPAPKKK